MADSEKSDWVQLMVANQPKSDDPEISELQNAASYKFAINASWAVNCVLLIIKIVAVILSNSKAVTAALVDSAVDLVSQAVLSLADRFISHHSPEYPVGRSRLEALSVIACAFIMSMASIEVIQYSITDIINGIDGNIPELVVTDALYAILGVGIGLKFFLWLYCSHINKTAKSDTIEALAEDHFNDVISNSAAIATAAISFHTTAWWVDPAGAIIISVVIIYRWVDIIKEQVKKIVGYTAPPKFIKEVEKLALEHDSRLTVDCTRVYHFGARYNVEMEIVLPGTMTLMESHDIGLALQHKIEGLSYVERAFVHVDHQRRDVFEHKVDRELVLLAKAEETAAVLSAMNSPAAKESELRSRFSSNSKGKIEYERII